MCILYQFISTMRFALHAYVCLAQRNHCRYQSSFAVQSTMQHGQHVLKTCMFASGYTYTRLELKHQHHDHTYSTMYGQCVVTTTQLDVLCCEVITRAILTFSRTGIFSELPPPAPTPALSLMNPLSGNPGYGPELYLRNPENTSSIPSLVLMHLQKTSRIFDMNAFRISLRVKCLGRHANQKGVGYCLLLHRVQWWMCMPFGYEIQSTAAPYRCSGV